MYDTYCVMEYVSEIISSNSPSAPDEWCVVSKKKKNTLSKDKQYHKKMCEIYPHIVTFQKAERIQRKLNISHLLEKLTSREWIDFQIEGKWQYLKVQRGNDVEEEIDNGSKEYMTMEIGNGWNDKVVFWRSKSDNSD